MPSDARAFILGSSSPRRKQLLSESGYHFQVEPSTAEELHDPGLSPQDLVTTNAFLKAQEVSARFPAAIVLGSDTLVYKDGTPLGKPVDLEEAFSMVQSLVGRSHQVATGVAIVCQEADIDLAFCEVTDVTFHSLSDDEVRGYLDSIQPLDKAGGYAAQDNGERIIESISGSMNNVIGLPTERLEQELEKAGLLALLTRGD